MKIPLLFIIIVFYGCTHCEKTELPATRFTESDKLFFSYSVNDTLCFKSTKDSVKFVVINTSINEEKQLGDCIGECCEKYYQDETMTLKIQNSNNPYEQFLCSIGHDEINKSPAMLKADISYYSTINN